MDSSLCAAQEYFPALDCQIPWLSVVGIFSPYHSQVQCKLRWLVVQVATTQTVVDHSISSLSHRNPNHVCLFRAHFCVSVLSLFFFYVVGNHGLLVDRCWQIPPEDPTQYTKRSRVVYQPESITKWSDCMRNSKVVDWRPLGLPQPVVIVACFCCPRTPSTVVRSVTAVVIRVVFFASSAPPFW